MPGSPDGGTGVLNRLDVAHMQQMPQMQHMPHMPQIPQRTAGSRGRTLRRRDE